MSQASARMLQLHSRNSGSHGLTAARDVLDRLSKRCVECPPQTPSCPTCAADETCSLKIATCDSCASSVCVKANQFAGQVSDAKSATSIGPIVGGVIGGVLAILIAVFCIWFFCIRSRRRKDTWNPPEKRDQSTLARGENGSRAHSIASTVLTRASNVIQIAYIPGVTGRSPPVSPGVPPMPNISALNTANSTPQPDTHFFMADDLRNSTWSDTSVDPRISLAPSLARASSAMTVYCENAVVPPIPAQHAFRAQANMVSVKQSAWSGASTLSTTNPAHSSPSSQGGKPVPISGVSIVARNLMARPIEVKKTSSGTRVPTLANLARANSTRSDTGPKAEQSPLAFEEKEVAMSPFTVVTDSPLLSPAALKTRPSDKSLSGHSVSNISAVLPSEGPLGHQSPATRPDSGGLTAMIEDAIKSASADSRLSPQRQDSGPFSDIHELPDGRS